MEYNPGAESLMSGIGIGKVRKRSTGRGSSMWKIAEFMQGSENGKQFISKCGVERDADGERGAQY